ncbi:lipase secretion chaperone [Marinobacter adhaerens]|uniref:lipase secretion chaperone n=1 Tax=Marinobacter adhaerens TaxID=1033846 RepID=UPI001E5F32A7|nr:lipase secretion chaperone [Marinobacter adhaerens]MCD1645907.1 lipase chaperone [Marinobacter adhaerens]
MKRTSIEARRWLFPGALSAILAGSGLWYGLAGTAQTEAEITVSVPTQSATPAHYPTRSSESSEKLATDSAAQGPVHATTPESLGPQPFAASLSGTEIDGALTANGKGELVINLQVRDFFDYFLSTVGEVSPETAIQQIEAMARAHLPEPASSQALTLLDEYLAYKQASLQVMQTRLDPARAGNPGYQLGALGDALAQLKQLRAATFGSEAHQAFFGLEEAYSEYTLATLAIQQRTDLSNQGKQALVQWHRNQLPEQLRTTEQHLHASTRQQQARTAAIESASSPEAAGRQLAELGVNQDGVESVVSYLKQREQFDQRFQDFREAMDQADSSGLAEADLEKQRQALLERHFPQEQDRTWARLKMLGNG